jgi:5'(3')-deoxyribonucleotidase
MKNLYIDMDGVLADFDKGVYELCGKRPEHLSKNEMWDIIKCHYNDGKRFFKHLPLMADATMLWSNIEHHRPIILTATGNSIKSAEQEKYWWADLYFKGARVITVEFGKDKAEYAMHGDVLIDDRSAVIIPWVKAGGIGILHTSTIDTLKKLKKCGF